MVSVAYIAILNIALVLWKYNDVFALFVDKSKAVSSSRTIDIDKKVVSSISSWKGYEAIESGKYCRFL